MRYLLNKQFIGNKINIIWYFNIQITYEHQHFIIRFYFWKYTSSQPSPRAPMRPYPLESHILMSVKLCKTRIDRMGSHQPLTEHTHTNINIYIYCNDCRWIGKSIKEGQGLYQPVEKKKRLSYITVSYYTWSNLELTMYEGCAKKHEHSWVTPLCAINSVTQDEIQIVISILSNMNTGPAHEHH